jgi:hypothetical protein
LKGISIHARDADVVESSITPGVQSVGISYMYRGFWMPNKSHAMGSGNEFHVGPHIMIIGLDQKIMQTFNNDGSNGEFMSIVFQATPSSTW